MKTRKIALTLAALSLSIGIANAQSILPNTFVLGDLGVTGKAIIDNANIGNALIVTSAGPNQTVTINKPLFLNLDNPDGTPGGSQNANEIINGLQAKVTATDSLAGAAKDTADAANNTAVEAKNLATTAAADVATVKDDVRTATTTAKAAQTTAGEAMNLATTANTNSQDAIANVNRVEQNLNQTNVRVGQLSSEVKQLQNQFTNLSNQVAANRIEANRGIAGAYAFANTPALSGNKDFAIGVGVGGYGGQSAVAISAATRINANTVAKIGYSTNGGYGAGLGFEW